MLSGPMKEVALGSRGPWLAKERDAVFGTLLAGAGGPQAMTMVFGCYMGFACRRGCSPQGVV